MSSPRHLLYPHSGLRRVLLGVAIPRQRGGEAAAVRIAATGPGLESRVELLSSALAPLPNDLAQLWEAVERGEGRAGDLPRLGSGLAQFAAQLTHQIASSSELAEALALGVHAPALWQHDAGAPQYLRCRAVGRNDRTIGRRCL